MKSILQKSPAWLSKQGGFKQKFLDCEDGATAIEYALIAALVSIVLVVTLLLVGGNLDSVYMSISDALGL